VKLNDLFGSEWGGGVELGEFSWFEEVVFAEDQAEPAVEDGTLPELVKHANVG
jgi:hypothetical protein